MEPSTPLNMSASNSNSFCPKKSPAKSRNRSGSDCCGAHPPKAASTPVTQRRPLPPAQAQASFLTLPTEIHLAISKLLIYPDALSLKYTNRYFHSFVDTGINLKVEWLMERRRLHLECPNRKRCDLGTDLRFCRGSVALLMKRRREHIECESRPGLGCIIYGTPTCPNRKKGIKAWQRWLETRLTIELKWVLLALLLALFGWLYTLL